MIAVIADDFTGAAELGGIGLRYHLTVEVNTAVNPATTADILIIATDARSLPKQEAVQIMQQHMQQLMALKPDLIFKKTDSVLRGHIVAELIAQLPIAGCHKAVLVPANPVLGRTIKNGRYFLHGQPVHETSFNEDPEFAITSSAIEDMLKVNGHTVYVRKVTDALPEAGIIVGEATATDDLHAWAAKVDRQTLAAGAAGFFEAILETRYLKKEAETLFEIADASLFVCGSTFARSREVIQEIKDAGGPVCYMPEELIRLEHTDNYTFVKWADEVAALIKEHGKAIVAIHPDSTKGVKIQSAQLREKMAGLVNEVLQRNMVKELLIEGGATAWSVINTSGLNQFFPLQELAAGVVRMQIDHTGMYVTLKPGSYAWPDGIWNF